MPSMCGSKVLTTLPNPENGKRFPAGVKAVVTRENCGATTDYSTNVRVLNMDGKPAGRGDGVVFSYYHGTPNVSVTWKDSDHLLIDCPQCGSPDNIFLKTTKYNFAEIDYAQ